VTAQYALADTNQDKQLPGRTPRLGANAALGSPEVSMAIAAVCGCSCCRTAAAGVALPTLRGDRFEAAATDLTQHAP